MKRILSFVLTFLILCSLATPAFASQLSGGNDVVAKYNITYEGEYRANVAGGTATAGGITVTGAPANAVTLVVITLAQGYSLTGHGLSGVIVGLLLAVLRALSRRGVLRLAVHRHHLGGPVRLVADPRHGRSE